MTLSHPVIRLYRAFFSSFLCLCLCTLPSSRTLLSPSLTSRLGCSVTCGPKSHFVVCTLLSFSPRGDIQRLRRTGTVTGPKLGCRRPGHFVSGASRDQHHETIPSGPFGRVGEPRPEPLPRTDFTDGVEGPRVPGQLGCRSAGDTMVG